MLLEDCSWPSHSMTFRLWEYYRSYPVSVSLVHQGNLRAPEPCFLCIGTNSRHYCSPGSEYEVVSMPVFVRSYLYLYGRGAEREDETGGSRVISRCLSPPGYLPPVDGTNAGTHSRRMEK